MTEMEIPRDGNGDIRTNNDFLVGRGGNWLSIAMLGVVSIDRMNALLFAAWIVALADDDDQFPAILEAVRNT